MMPVTVSSARPLGQRSILPRFGRTQIVKRVNFKEPNNRPGDNLKKDFESAKDKARDNFDSAKDSTRDHAESAKNKTRDTFQSAKGEARDTFQSAKGEARDTYESAKGNARDAYESTKDTARDKLHDVRQSAEETGDRVKSTLSNARDELDDTVKRSNPATVMYLITAAATLAVAVYKLSRPDTVLTTLFSDAMTTKGAEVAAFTGSLASSAFLIKISGALVLPIAAANVCLAQASRAGNLGSDSAMRLNYGLSLIAGLLLSAFISSPLRSSLGAQPTVSILGYVVLFAVATFYGARGTQRFKSLSTMMNDVNSGIISTAVRVITPRTWAGIVYAVFCGLTTFAAASMTFGQTNTASYINTSAAETGFAAAHTDLVRFVAGGIAANLSFLAVAFATLKELADKGGLATKTARFLNAGISAALVALGVILSAANSRGLVYSQAAGKFALVSQVTAVMAVASIFFTLFPNRKSPMKEDTPAECY